MGVTACMWTWAIRVKLGCFASWAIAQQQHFTSHVQIPEIISIKGLQHIYFEQWIWVDVEIQDKDNQKLVLSHSTPKSCWWIYAWCGWYNLNMNNCNVSFLPMVRALSGQAEDSKGDDAIRMVYSRHSMESEDFSERTWGFSGRLLHVTLVNLWKKERIRVLNKIAPVKPLLSFWLWDPWICKAQVQTVKVIYFFTLI